MTYFIRTTLLFAFVITLAACETETTEHTVAEDPMGASQAAPPVDGADVEAGMVAQMQDGVQVISVTAGPTGYRPDRIEVQEGVPVRLIFKRTTPSACAEEIQIPAFDVAKTELPLNEDVEIRFTPDETGEFTFACGMDMMKGAIVVRS